ncbi:hypothetical protein Hanom_Chr03g00238501 [Helianthus anomalus]
MHISHHSGFICRIFTDMSISPSLSSRQCPDRYAFRAGRNLPDKKNRYIYGRRSPGLRSSAPLSSGHPLP